jgi:hypothetical protein
MQVSAKYLQASVALVAVVVALVVPATTAFASSDPNPGVLPPQSHPFGLTYSEWSARWWQFAMSISVHSPPFSTNVNHPFVDLTGSKCAVGQSGKVFFLGGAIFANGAQTTTMITRNNCTVPHGKALFFPLLNDECSFLEGPTNMCPGTSVDELRADIAPFINAGVNLSASVDGRAITIGSATGPFRVQSPPFTFTLPADNVLTFSGEHEPGGGAFPPGTFFPMVGDGIYVMLAPLSSGAHTIQFNGESDGFMLNVTYNLTVG